VTLLNRDAILVYLAEVAAELPEGFHETVVVVGGSMLAVVGLRQATKDVDTARRHSQALAGAAARVAERHDLAPDWLNSSASAWAPDDGVVALTDGPPVLDLPTLRVHVATADTVFVMKVHAGRPQDYPDIVALWPLCSFDSYAAAAYACNQAYTHLSEPDEHLAFHIQRIIETGAEASRKL
jgi:hypothetical protein